MYFEKNGRHDDIKPTLGECFVSVEKLLHEDNSLSVVLMMDHPFDADSTLNQLGSCLPC